MRIVIRVIFAAALLLPGAAKAQTQKQKWSAGVSTGAAINRLSYTTGYRAFSEYKPSAGVALAIPVHYRVNDWLAVQAEVGYVAKSYRFVRTGDYDHTHWTASNSYLQLPMMAQFSFGGARLRGFVNMGAFGGYWLRSRWKGQTEEVGGDFIYKFNENILFNKTRDNRWEAGGVLGAGVSYELPLCIMTLEGRYYHSVTDMQKKYMLNQVPRYNNTAVLQVGALFPFGR